MSKFKSLGIFLGILTVALAFVLINSSQKTTNSKLNTNLRIGNTNIQVEIVDSAAEIEQGLSIREKLGKNEGMYFVLSKKQIVEFWMKDMRFPLDIIWIAEGKIVGFVENAPIPSGNTIPTFTSPQPITHVLEVNAGFVKQRSIKKGDEVTSPN